MPAINNPFTPILPTLRMSATAASSSGSINIASNQIRIANLGPNKVFVRWGNGAQTAVTTDTPVLAGAVEVFTKPTDANTIAAICDASETATVFVTSGEGS